VDPCAIATPVSVPIQIIRNSGYAMPVSLEDNTGAPFPTPGYLFLLEIAPSRSDNSWPTTPSFTQEITAGPTDSGANFLLLDTDTAALDYRLDYQWRVLAQAPGAAPATLTGGPAFVLDGPVWPPEGT
jgi:hypothetical protein